LATIDRLLQDPTGRYPDRNELVTRLLAFVAEPGAPARVEILAGLAGARPALAAGVSALLSLALDSDPAVRAAATAALGALPERADQILSSLLGGSARERDPGVRLAQVLAVGRLVGAAGTTTHRRRALAWLRRRRAAADPTLRLAATAMAWRVGAARASDLPALRAVVAAAGPRASSDWLADELRDDRDARVAVALTLFEAPDGGAALTAAGYAVSTWRSAGPALLPLVAARLDDPTPGVRAGAAHLLAAVDPAAYSDALAGALSDPAARVADLAAWGLARAGDPRCLPRLRNRALMGTSIFDVVRTFQPPGSYPFGAPGLLDVLAPLAGWAAELLPRIASALADADTYHQRRVLADALRCWGPAAAGAVPELVDLLETDAAGPACRALGAIGAAARPAGPRLLRLVRRGGSSRLRAVAAWAHWRVGGEPEPARRILGEALLGDLGPLVLPWLADLGPAAAAFTGRVRQLAAEGSDRVRIDAARAIWRMNGDRAQAWDLLLPVLVRLTERRIGPAGRRALRVAGELVPVPAAALAPLRAVVVSDRRYGCYGDWRAVVDDDEFVRLAGAALDG
jgi:hypothetical protein